MESKEIQIQVIRSARRTISLEISRDGQVILRVPFGMGDAEVRRFLNEKKSWIKSHLKKARSQMGEIAPEERLTDQQIHKLAEQAAKVIPERVAHFAPQVGVTYGKITIRSQRTRWGSCSDKGNLSFNCLLMLVPHEVLDYVVVHELCHRKQMNHSKAFWAEVAKVLPDYRTQSRWLKEHGGHLIRRMTG